jgi:hypothetical protein
MRGADEGSAAGPGAPVSEGLWEEASVDRPSAASSTVDPGGPPSAVAPAGPPSAVAPAGPPSAVAPAGPPSAVAPAAVPVALELSGRHAASVRRWVEGVLGWQPVDDDPAGPVPPAIRLADHHPAGSPSAGAALPLLLIVDDDASAPSAAALVHATGPDAVLPWPSGRDRLPEVVAALLRRPQRGGSGPRVLRVGGAAGGVGTTTVTLALAGLLGWQGHGTLALVRPPAAVPALHVVPGEAVGAVDLWARADELPAVPRGRVLGIAGGEVPAPADHRIAAAVIDAGVDDDVDVLVCRPDAAGLARLAATTAAAVVLVGAGPASPKDLVWAAGGRAGVAVPWSSRVARAGLHGRVPGSLPGRWLRRLAPLVSSARDGSWGAMPSSTGTARSVAAVGERPRRLPADAHGNTRVGTDGNTR